jgi:predicted regulator of Ras-like GTPase activity (Roadblock/LC7/MglB family)
MMSSLVQTARGQICRMPEVTALVMTDRSGTLVEASGDIDAEAAGAVYTVAAEAFERLGDQLGLGPFDRAAVTGVGSACIVALTEQGVVGIQVDPKKPIGAIERKLETLLRR